MIRLSEQYDLINQYRRRAPVDVEGLARALGLEVTYSFLDPKISGALENDKKRDRFRISVNANDPSTRQRFTIAHELGHYMLHRSLVGDGIDDDRAYRSTDAGKYKNTRIGRHEETQANRFAASLLMPQNLIDQARNDGANSPQSLARKLGVSEQAMCIRIGEPFEPPFL
jgi:Zn-dependent peptidase ImmA (M78 family)